jgi:hypothetical protein
VYCGLVQFMHRIADDQNAIPTVERQLRDLAQGARGGGIHGIGVTA